MGTQLDASATNKMSCFEAHYRRQFRHVAPEVRRVKVPELTLMRSRQGPGDWSCPAIPELALVKQNGSRVDADADLGAVRFQRRLIRGDTFVAAPGVATRVRFDRPHDVILLAVDYAKLQALCANLALPEDGCFAALHRGPVRDPLVIGLIDCLWAEADADEPPRMLLRESALVCLAAALVAGANGKQVAPEAKGQLAPWQERRAIERLTAELAGNVSLASLAADVGLSPFHFARAFKRSTGLPPHRYQTMLRIERAKELLRDGRRSITTIALDLGYGSSQSLARAFTREVGISPLAYRRRAIGA